METIKLKYNWKIDRDNNVLLASYKAPGIYATIRFYKNEEEISNNWKNSHAIDIQFDKWGEKEYTDFDGTKYKFSGSYGYLQHEKLESEAFKHAEKFISEHEKEAFDCCLDSCSSYPDTNCNKFFIEDFTPEVMKKFEALKAKKEERRQEEEKFRNNLHREFKKAFNVDLRKATITINNFHFYIDEFLEEIGIMAKGKEARKEIIKKYGEEGIKIIEKAANYYN